MSVLGRLRGELAILALVAIVALVAIGAGLALHVLQMRPEPAPPVATPPLPKTPVPEATAWLGLNYNSGSDVGSLRDFSLRGIVYDREGRIEVAAGRTPETSDRLRSGLATTYAAHMVPDLQMNPRIGSRGCLKDPVPTQLCLPVIPRDIAVYVRDFVQTARAVLRAYPNHRVLFEPMDEPWDWAFPPGTQSGTLAATEYARVLAQLLPAAKAAQVPLRDIFVPATGTLDDGSSWIPDLYQAQPCLKPGPGSCGPIAAWNLHPYGLPHLSTEGIDSVPTVRAQMLSGQNRLVISEIGFCALDVQNGNGCDYNLPDIRGTSAQTAAWLRETLNEAARMHRVGWLKAMLIWYRSGGGFAMQNRNGTLTAQGRVLDLFAQSPAAR